ncbi:MAG TPA: cytochrome P450, partial [Haliangiales bacterium]|nr:cytochrome P450 [Haliangiales bacterium]
DRLMQIPALQPVFAEPYNQIIRTQILAADPPDHTRIRALVNPPFTVPKVDTLRARIQAHVDRLIAAKADGRRMDFIRDFAYPLPFTMICDLLAVPDAERPPLEDYTHKLMRTTDPMPMSPYEVAGANYAAMGFRDYFLALATERSARPTDDLFGQMVAARDRGALTDEEMVANVTLVFCAGHDTVVNLFGNGLYHLCRNPDQLELLRRDPSLMKNAVEELLRYDASVQIARRIPFQDVEIGGKTIFENQYILCCLGAANRDPEVYPDPDRLDIMRKNIRPHSFGGGIHYCLGAQLARVEGEIVFRTILERMPELRLETEDPEWHQNTFVRGLASLPIAW